MDIAHRDISTTMTMSSAAFSFDDDPFGVTGAVGGAAPKQKRSVKKSSSGSSERTASTKSIGESSRSNRSRDGKSSRSSRPARHKSDPGIDIGDGFGTGDSFPDPTFDEPVQAAPVPVSRPARRSRRASIATSGAPAVPARQPSMSDMGYEQHAPEPAAAPVRRRGRRASMYGEASSIRTKSAEGLEEMALRGRPGMEGSSSRREMLNQSRSGGLEEMSSGRRGVERSRSGVGLESAMRGSRGGKSSRSMDCGGSVESGGSGSSGGNPAAPRPRRGRRASVSTGSGFGGSAHTTPDDFGYGVAEPDSAGNDFASSDEEGVDYGYGDPQDNAPQERRERRRTDFSDLAKGSAGSKRQVSASSRQLGAGLGANMVVPMTAPEKPQRRGRRASLVGAIGAIGNIGGGGKKKQEEDTPGYDPSQDRSRATANSLVDRISSSGGDVGTSGSGGGGKSYSDRIMGGR